MSRTGRKLPHCYSALPAAALLLLGVAAQAGDPVTILYSERPPFNITQPDGDVVGIVGAPAGAALRKAGIPFTWEAIPTNRSVYEVQENRRRVCGLGWYRTPERAEFARFTDPISQDGPLVAVVGRSFHNLDATSFDAVLHDETARFLLKSGVLYTSATSAQLDKAKIRARWVTIGWGEIVQEIADQHADITFLIEEEAAYYLRQGPYKPGDLTVLRFAELPRGELRRLMCSKLVDDDTIQAINKALGQR
jgi:polar amino acid transport system substrate-binding protein